MKKIKSILLFGTMVLAAIACTREAAPEKAQEPEGELVSVCFPVALSEEGATKATAIDPDEKLLWVYVFDDDATPSPALLPGLSQKLTMENGKATVHARLLSGKNYTLAFWAASAAYDADGIFTPTNDDVEVHLMSIYGAYGPGSPILEAFYGKVSFKAGESHLPAVTLKRPFAQVNVCIPYADSLYAAGKGVDVKTVKTAFEVKKLHELFSLRQGSDVSSAAKSMWFNWENGLWDRFIDVRDAGGSPVTAECYTRAASFFVLADDVHTQIEGEVVLRLDCTVNGHGCPISKDLGTIPIRPNQQTNIMCTLFEGNLNPLYRVDLYSVGEGYLSLADNLSDFMYKEGDTVELKFIAFTQNALFSLAYEVIDTGALEYLTPSFTNGISEGTASFAMPAGDVKVTAYFNPI